MESTVSVSKGVFLFPNKYSKHKVSKKKSSNLYDKLFSKEPWHETFKSNWAFIDNELKELHHRTYSLLLNDIVNHVKNQSESSETLQTLDGIIPSATLLTGVNQPDHVSQFDELVHKIRKEVTPHIAMISSQDAPSLKHLVENTVGQLIYGNSAISDTHDDEEMDCGSPNKKLKKNQCTMRALQKFYQSRYTNIGPKKKVAASRKSLVIIFPDFESFNCTVLQDFVMIVSSYISSLPIVFVFGVATSVSALHKSFPYHVSSKLLIKVFHSHASPVYMNQVLEQIFLTHTSPLHLSGKAFQLLTDVFLFYDFSVTGLVQSIKYCMMEHYYGDNIKTLCCERNKLEESIANLSDEDLEQIRQLLSFRQFVESHDVRTQIKMFEDNDFFREILFKQMNKLHDYLYSFYVCVRLINAIVEELPKKMIGKAIREIYAKCAATCITETEAFKECMQLVGFQSQVQLTDTIKSCLKLIDSSLKNASPIKPLRSSPTKNNSNTIRVNDCFGESFIKTVRVNLHSLLRQIESANIESSEVVRMSTDGNDEDEEENIPLSRQKLRQNLLKATRPERVQSEFEMIRGRFVRYLEDVFAQGLLPPHTQAFHEIVFFTDVAGVRKQIVGSPRGALHTALSNPVHYLQCTCCHLPSLDSMSDTLPDVSLAYKLHRECGKLINLYDWLQAFQAVLTPQRNDDDDDSNELHANVQARFTRAVAELQFLGLIKSSKRKTDHVMRLTW